MKLFVPILSAAVLAASITPTQAHHSFAMFENDKTITIVGTVKEFEWVNPHAWIHVMVMPASGTPQEWSFEMGSTGQLNRQGWKADSVKEGDAITVMARPMKDGSYGGSFMSATLPDGRTFGGRQGAPAAPAP